tara:strand:- start:962 stop:1618 length:657 start_codon:yes stop_codon:yes gene_type:complete
MYVPLLLLVWGVGSVVVQIVRSALFLSHFQHFTSWVWTLQAVYFTVEAISLWFGWTGVQSINTMFLLPTTFALLWFVYIAISFLGVWNITLLTDALDEYGEATVGGINFLLHYLPWVVLGVYMLLNEKRIKETSSLFIDKCKQNGKMDLFVLTTITIPTCFLLSYLFWFSPSKEYGISKISDSVGTVVSVVLVEAALCCYVMWIYPKFSPSPLREKLS